MPTVHRAASVPAYVASRPAARVCTLHGSRPSTSGTRPLDALVLADLEKGSGRLDFGVVQFRAASPRPAPAPSPPGTHMVWDVLHHPGPTATSPPARRALLAALLAGEVPPVQVVPSSDDYEVARAWYESFLSPGIEGFTGPRARPRWGSGVRLSARLAAGQAARIGRELVGGGEAGEASRMLSIARQCQRSGLGSGWRVGVYLASMVWTACSTASWMSEAAGFQSVSSMRGHRT